MQTRNTIAKYQTTEDAAERKRLLGEAEARRRAMLAGVGYADLVQCRAFLNEFNSDEMLVRWASLRWSIIALGAGIQRWFRASKRGSRSETDRLRQIRRALGHWVNMKLSRAQNKWREFAYHHGSAFQMARRSLAHWLQQQLAAGFNQWRWVTQDALRSNHCPPPLSTLMSTPVHVLHTRALISYGRLSDPLCSSQRFHWHTDRSCVGPNSSFPLGSNAGSSGVTTLPPNAEPPTIHWPGGETENWQQAGTDGVRSPRTRDSR